MNTTMKAIERTEEIYGEMCDAHGQLSSAPVDIRIAADLAAIECGIEDRASFIRGYVTTRRLIDSMAPARDPFAEFVA